MALATLSVANALKILIAGLPGMGEVQLGLPKASDALLSASITAGSQALNLKTAGGTLRRDARYFIDFHYYLEGDEAAAESALMELVDAFLVGLFEDMTLGGSCSGIEVDAGLADLPEYRARAGREFREYPLVVTAKQIGAFNANP